VIDAMIVAIDVMDKHCKHYKYSKKLCILTDASEEYNWGDMEAVEGMIEKHNIELTIV
jgi:hypothetical protein